MVIMPMTQSVVFDQSQSELTCTGGEGGFGDQADTVNFNFDVSAITPIGSGTLIVEGISGDLNNAGEFYDIDFDGIVAAGQVGDTGGVAPCGGETDTLVFNLTESQLQAAAADGTIVITATPSGAINCVCGNDLGDIPNQVTVRLEFSGNAA
jgi:hypothetical protein